MYSMISIICFVRNPNLEGHENWFDNKMFVYSDKEVVVDNRTSVCAKLNELMHGESLINLECIG